MKHTTFEKELEDIRRKAINELKDAVKAHGKKNEFADKLEPIMSNGMKAMGIYTMDESHMNTFGLYCPLFVRPTNGGDCVFAAENMPIEDILAITEAIPNTDKVKDVSGVYPKPILWIDTDDIATANYDPSTIDDEYLDKIATHATDYILNEGIFYDAVRYACHQCGVKEKEG